jgi:phosphopantothenoylcysteine decarboxylase/phosphopantothenate--cysteine ligase
VNVESAEEMYRAALEYFPTMDAGILCAAVADYKPLHFFFFFLKRKDNDGFTLELTPNPDIAAALGKMKKPEQLLVGFALETDNERVHAEEKLRKKNLDFIVLNSLKDEGACFGQDTNKIMIMDAHRNGKEFPLKTKREVAKDIVDETIGRLGVGIFTKAF